MPQPRSDPDPPAICRRPLPVTVAVGMPVVEIDDGLPGTIAGLTQAFCIYRINDSGALAVARWRDVALGNICPADPLLPGDVTERDRSNGQAALLRELLALQQFGLSDAQTAALEELMTTLCPAWPG